MSSHLIETKVDSDGLTQLIQRLGRDCTPTQFVREFVQNAIEAVQRTGKPGEIVVDANWDMFNKTQVHKISFTDNGDGMTPGEMLKHLNNLSSSGQDSNVFENYGVGAKIAALTRNHVGIIYESWKDGQGARIFIHFDEEANKYGVMRFDLPTGEATYHLTLSDSEKPKQIEDHGTRVTLLGMEKDEDTMRTPGSTKGGRENWLGLYLNTRYFKIPEDITMKARVAYYKDFENTRHNYLRTINGQSETLSRFTEKSGVVKLSDAIVHWWILKPDRDGHSRELVAGHTGCINQNELFDISEGRSSRAVNFGIYMGKENIVLYVEPTTAKYVQNTARTGLVGRDGSHLPWSKWEDEFRENMPKALEEYIKRKLDEVSADSHEEKIRDRLKSIADFYKISRYRKAVQGDFSADPETEVRSLTGSPGSSNGSKGGKRGKKGGLPGGFEEILLSGLSENGVKAEKASPDKFPQFKWLSVNDGSRDPIEMDDRAAQYLPKDNLILANADFQGFVDVIEHFTKQYSEIEGAEKIVQDTVREAFEQQLIEVITGSLSLQNRPRWKPDEFDKSISEESLTAAVMPRYFLLNHIKRQLGNHFKNIRTNHSTAE